MRALLEYVLNCPETAAPRLTVVVICPDELAQVK
jgi:hypothetical protein